MMISPVKIMENVRTLLFTDSNGWLSTHFTLFDE